jgi:glycogen debranching enzyme
VWVPAAGVPWFVAVFGRDSLIVSLQNMLVHAGFARGALKKLAALQATEADDARDAQPGKMPHELRAGELAHFRLIPHTPYYGTADATPLYLIVLHEAWRWLGDESLLREHRDVAVRCLEWIDQYGDFDGDGFQEYRTRSPQGYENMGWKDALDAVVYPDGTQVRQPKALCELQGYVFDSEAASYFASYRLPELYAGVAREEGNFPVLYPAANVPQAWAAGSVFHLLQAILGLRGDAPEGRLFVDPVLPRWLPEITLHELAIGGARVDLRFWRDRDRTRWDASLRQGKIEVEEERWQPWAVS